MFVAQMRCNSQGRSLNWKFNEHLPSEEPRNIERRVMFTFCKTSPLKKENSKIVCSISECFVSWISRKSGRKRTSLDVVLLMLQFSRFRAQTMFWNQENFALLLCCFFLTETRHFALWNKQQNSIGCFFFLFHLHSRPREPINFHKRSFVSLTRHQAVNSVLQMVGVSPR